MYRILVPIDYDVEFARKQVELIPALPGDADEIEVTVLHVFEELDGSYDEGAQSYVDELNENREPPESVGKAVAILEEAGIEPNVVFEAGDPTEVILERADELDVDQIVIGGHKRSPIGKVLFGSVAQAVILSSDRPVTVVGSSTE